MFYCFKVCHRSEYIYEYIYLVMFWTHFLLMGFMFC